MFPTRQSLGLMKSKLKGAEIGHSLLKRKSEALTKYYPNPTLKLVTNASLGAFEVGGIESLYMAVLTRE